MRVRTYQLNDRLYFLAPEDTPAVLVLEIAEGIRIEQAPHGRLLLTNDKNAWVGVLSLALRLGWCRISDESPEAEEDGLGVVEP